VKLRLLVAGTLEVAALACFVIVVVKVREPEYATSLQPFDPFPWLAAAMWLGTIGAAILVVARGGRIRFEWIAVALVALLAESFLISLFTGIDCSRDCSVALPASQIVFAAAAVGLLLVPFVAFGVAIRRARRERRHRQADRKPRRS
jgi:lysylphosphatidylglycerol synthetase-like protein (DUF2156 family)